MTQKKNARPSKAESSAIEQRKFTADTSITATNLANIHAAEYEGFAFSFTGDGWFNATAAAKRYGKEPAQWLRLPATVAYIGALQRKYGNFTYLKTRRGVGGSSWMHPKLAVRFAQWLDVDFAVWCDEQIDHILRGGLTIWDKGASEPSTTSDREMLLTAAAAIVARHRLSYSTVYEALNTFAGVAHAREMTCGQVVASTTFAARLLTGGATSDDYKQVEDQRAERGCDIHQMGLADLFGGHSK